MKIKHTAFRNWIFLILGFLVSISLESRLGLASTRSNQTLEALSSGNLATRDFLRARNFQSATAHFTGGDEKKGWKQYTERKPVNAAIKLEIDRKLLNLDEDLNTIDTYYRNREKDSFLLGRMEPQLYDVIASRGLELRQSKVTFEHFATTAFPANPSWSEDPFKDRNWQFSLHNFAVIRYLLAAHKKTNDDWYLKRAEELTTDWMADNFGPSPPSEFSWNDHTTALRLENLIYLFEYARKRQMDGPFLQTLLAAIYVHGNVLSDESFYYKHSNHGLDQSYILYWAGAVFPEFPESARWREIGKERVKDEINFEFSPEGVHVENTPTYHFWIINKVIDIDQIFRNYEGKPIYTGMDKLTDHALEYTAYITKPNGKYPLFGDAEEIYRPEDNKALGALNGFAYQHFLYSVTQGERGTRPPQTDYVFQRSGYAIFRDVWHGRSDFAQTIYLALKAGFLSTVHKHNDDLSFVLYGYGEDWIIDSGLFRYQSDDPFRRYALSNKAHNVVLVDDLEESQDEGDVGRSHIDAFVTNKDRSSVIASHSLYAGFVVSRRVDYYKPGSIHISDTVSSLDGNLHTYRILFHVPGDKVVTVKGQAAIVQSARSGKTLTINHSGGVVDRVYIISGQKEPYYQGWVSTSYRNIEKSVCVVFETSGKKLDSTIDLEFR